MTRGETALLAGAILSLAAALAMPRAVAPIAPGSSGERPRGAPGVRLTMMELHRQGGVPRGWQPRVPPGDADAGRATFVALGCPSCHRVAGEAFSRSAPSGPGPELSGMGSHHPAAYFAEALLDPDAVVLEGAGWVDDDGRSTMPAYPDLTVRQLGDLVTYLTSLKQDAAAASAHEAMSGRGITVESITSRMLPDAPAAPDGRTYYAQSYDVLPEQLPAFERWLATTGRARLLDVEGLVAVDTYADLERPGTPLTTVLAFRDEAAFRTFLADPASADLWRELDAFVGPHGHRAIDRPPIYRVPSLSLDAAG